MDLPRCLFFTKDSDDYVKNQCVFTWFLKVMLLSMVFGLFSIGFPMDFHGEGFWESPYSSQKAPVAPQWSLKPPGPKVEGVCGLANCLTRVGAASCGAGAACQRVELAQPELGLVGSYPQSCEVHCRVQGELRLVQELAYCQPSSGRAASQVKTAFVKELTYCQPSFFCTKSLPGPK